MLWISLISLFAGVHWTRKTGYWSNVFYCKRCHAQTTIDLKCFKASDTQSMPTLGGFTKQNISMSGLPNIIETLTFTNISNVYHLQQWDIYFIQSLNGCPLGTASATTVEKCRVTKYLWQSHLAGLLPALEAADICVQCPSPTLSSCSRLNWYPTSSWPAECAE